jgi:soluble lytic murein transglycosylase-like protein
MYTLGKTSSFAPAQLRTDAIGQKIATQIGTQLQRDAAARIGADQLRDRGFQSEAARSAVDTIRAEARMPRVPPNLSDACKCYTQAAVDFAVSQGAPPPPVDVVAELAATCAVDEAGFRDALKAGGISISQCVPVWKRPSTWVIGGAAALGLFLVLR